MTDNNNSSNMMVCLLLVGVLIVILCICRSNSEHFSNHNRYVSYSNTPDYSDHSYADQLWTGRLAKDCYDKDVKDCTKYTNCGVCMKDGQQTCVPGDEEGPMFKGGCDRWGYVNYYDNRAYTGRYNRDHTNMYTGDYSVSRPWDHFYPDYEYWAPMPTGRVY